MQSVDEYIWLRHRILRLRAALRFAKDPRVEAILRELIGEAEERLISVERDDLTAHATSPPLRLLP